LGETWNDDRMKYLGCRCMAVIDFYHGEFAASRVYFERTLALYDPAHRAYLTALTSQDPHCSMLLHFSWTLACLGYLDQARGRLDEGLAAGRQNGRSDTIAFSIMVACTTLYLLRSATQLRLERADELIALSAKHGFSMFEATGKFWRGSCLVASGNTDEGITLLKDVLASHRAAGLELFIPFSLIALAEAYGFAGLPQEGLKVLAEPGELLRPTPCCWWEAEMHRHRGELLRSTGDDAGAEGSFQQGLVVARRQDAKLFELRTAVGLARLWRDGGRREEARDLLAPICDWFTEGFDTPDLQEAKALLDEFGS
jgi:predicted ATPase